MLCYDTYLKVLECQACASVQACVRVCVCAVLVCEFVSLLLHLGCSSVKLALQCKHVCVCVQSYCVSLFRCCFTWGARVSSLPFCASVCVYVCVCAVLVCEFVLLLLHLGCLSVKPNGPTAPSLLPFPASLPTGTEPNSAPTWAMQVCCVQPF